MNVWIVFHCNYDDQGVDFKGIFSTKEIAELWLKLNEPNKDNWTWYNIEEVEVQEEIIRTIKWNREQTEYLEKRLKDA